VIADVRVALHGHPIRRIGHSSDHVRPHVRAGGR
jgi:hypothetical protein